MSSSLTKPLVRRRDDGLQLRYSPSKMHTLFSALTILTRSYTLPHRVFAAKPYPVLSPNGSAIFIYGYENGIRIIWRGGRPFLPLRKQKSTGIAGGKSNR